jgi:LPS export ABC transporter protein LptC
MHERPIRSTCLALCVCLMKLNSKFFKVIAAALILIAIIFGGYFFLRGTDILVPSLFRPSPGERLLLSMDGFKFTQSENGSIAWRVNAGSADLYENKEAQLKEIEIIFISSTKDRKEATLLGEHGILDTSSGNASIMCGAREVRVATSDGYLLTTDTLSWKAGERLVWTADPFKLIGKEIYLEGVGISANVDMHTILVKNNVKAVLQE